MIPCQSLSIISYWDQKKTLKIFYLLPLIWQIYYQQKFSKQLNENSNHTTEIPPLISDVDRMEILVSYFKVSN